MLAHLRCGDTYARLAAGFGVGVATVYRYIREAVEVLATLAPTRGDAERAASATAYVFLDARCCRSTGSPQTGPSTRESTRSTG